MNWDCVFGLGGVIFDFSRGDDRNGWLGRRC
jgi:hypothetical protein